VIIFGVIIIFSKQYILNGSSDFHFQYALVLGAGLENSSEPSDILLDRVLTAVTLYKTGKIDFLIMSGAAKKEKNEVAVMALIAKANGVPSAAIILDGRGFSTFQSCRNFISDHSPASVLLISQLFHLPRAILIQRLLGGVQAYGFAARDFHFSVLKIFYWYMREVIALPYNFFKYLCFLLK
jgi:SanA protein